MYRSVLIVCTALTLLSNCSRSPGADSAVTEIADDFGSRLGHFDHRFLDTLQPSLALLGTLAEDDHSFPYALGRAYEGRSRDEAALTVYDFIQKLGVVPWDGFASVRGAAISLSRGDLPATLAWADRAIDTQPNNRDGWWFRGTALYRMEEYRQLESLIESMPAIAEFSLGFSADTETLVAETAVWRAIAALETSGDTQPFIDAFVTIPAGSIHSRLYLYVFYRDRGFSMFSSEERLLLEAVYRTAIDERQEALRLFSMIEPAPIASWLDTAAASEYAGDERPLLGLWGTLNDAFAVERSGVSAWLSRIADLSGSHEYRFSLLRTQPAAGLSSGERLALLQQVAVASDETLIRELALRRYIDTRIDSGDPLLSVVEDLSNTPVSSTEYERIVDRLMPAVVDARDWGALPAILDSIPLESKRARGHVQYVIGVVAESGLYDFGERFGAPGARSALFGESSSRQEIDFFKVSVASMEGASIFGFEPEDTRSIVDGGVTGTEPIVVDELDRGKPTYIALRYADSLITAGQVEEARRIVMAYALDSSVSETALALARRFSSFGHYSAALDVARRVYARNGRPIHPADVTILYPSAYMTEIAAAATRNGVAIAVLNGLVREESHFRPVAESYVGARGLAQLMPATADDMARRMNREVVNLDDPEENLQFGAFYLNYLSEQISEPLLQVAAYNAGLGRGRSWVARFGDLPPRLQIEAIPFIETRWYVRRVSVSAAIYQWLRDGTPVEEGFELFLGGQL